MGAQPHADFGANVCKTQPKELDEDELDDFDLDEKD